MKAKIEDPALRAAAELFANVARLASKDEAARNPKVQAALDNGLEKPPSQGRKGAKERRKIIDGAGAANRTVHGGRIFEAWSRERC